MASLSLSLMRTRRASDQKGKNGAFCKKHPKHRQSPGVCSLCLNEKLSQHIKSSSCSSSSSERRKHVLCSSSSSLSSYCSSSVSSCPSPLDLRHVDKGLSWMRKSRSLACNASHHEITKTTKRTKGGFFSTLVGPRRYNNRV